MPQFLIPAVIGAGASLIGSATQADAATSAADTQAAAANRATDAQQANIAQTRSDLSPYRDDGTTASADLNNRLFNGGDLSSGPGMYTGAGDVFNGQPSLVTGGALPSTYQPWGTGAAAQQDLQNTPGYQFTLQQGLKSLGNSYAARGLGISGAGLKGAAQYTTGLADNTYNQQLQNNMLQQGQQYSQGLSNQQTQFSQGLQGQGQYFAQGLAGNQQTLAGQNQIYTQALGNQDAIYNRLMGMLGIGANAAAGGGQLSLTGTTAANNLITGGAAAQAGGQIGSANAVASGLSGTSNNIMQAYLMNSLFGNGGAGGASDPWAAGPQGI